MQQSWKIAFKQLNQNKTKFLPKKINKSNFKLNFKNNV